MSSPSPTAPLAGVPGEAPTNVRYHVLAAMCSLALITYIDRVCISRMKGDIQADLGFTDTDMGLVFGAFTLAYSLFEVPMGWWGDVVGPRRVLTRIVLCWSGFTALTGCVTDLPLFGIAIPALWVMVTIRFLFGAGEAGAFPNIARSLGTWFPFSRRGFCQGMLWMSGRAGGAIAPVLVGIIASWLTHVQGWVPPLAGVPVWRVSFFVFALMGVVWCLFFYPWYRDKPEEKRGVNQAEIDLIRNDRPPGGGDGGHGLHGVPWGQIIFSANLWYLCTMYFMGAFGWYVYITFLPDFLKNVYGMKATDTEVWSLPLLGDREVPVFDIMCGMPLAFGAVGCLLGGPLTDILVKRVGWRWGRTGAGALAMFGCGALLAVSQSATTVWPAILLIAFSTMVKDLYMAPSWAVCVDIGGRYSGTVAAFMNMTGNMGGVVAPIIIGLLLDQWGKTRETWAWLFYLFALANVVGGVFWLLVDPTKSVVEEPPGGPRGHDVSPDKGHKAA